TNIMVGYRQTNQKTDTGKTLTRWPVFVDHFILNDSEVSVKPVAIHILVSLLFKQFRTTFQ
ncbi:hypothetical protein, partial [Klebsiella pneumoniae]|uniref:hypothetical protein n=1 Tax=Klebsiella pneumoniae TaxID=573 RepID=UPI0038D3F080